MKLLLAGLMALSSFSHAAIFGNDDRSLLTPASPFQPQGRATAIAVLSSNMTRNANGTIDLDAPPLPEMCKNEKHTQGPSLTFSCTGFLVAPNLLATAGHCVYAVNNPGQTMTNVTDRACKEFTWLFDYQADQAGRVQTRGIDPSKMYGCKRIIYAANREGQPFDDYALIELNRPVKDRAPYKVNASPLNPKSTLSVIGFPFGTAMKVAVNGKIRLDNPKRQSFITTLDVFEGNSGSPVLNEKREVVGILVGGTPSANTYLDARFQCNRQNRCDDNAKNCSEPDKDPTIFPNFQAVGSEVQRILPIVQLMQKRK